MIKFRSLLQRASTFLFTKPIKTKIIPQLFIRSTMKLLPQKSFSPLVSRVKYAFSQSQNVQRDVGKFSYPTFKNPEAEKLYQKGIKLIEQQKFDEGCESIKQSYKLQPQNVEITSHSGNILLVRYKQNEKAAELFNQVLKTRPNDVEALSNLAGCSYTRGDIEKTLQILSKCIELDPKHFGIISTRGGIYFSIGNIEKAIQDQTTAIGLKPNDMFAYNARSQMYSKIGQFQNAINDLKKALQIYQSKGSPKQQHEYYLGNTLTTLASCYAMMGKITEALDHCRICIDKDPEHPLGYLTMGNLLIDQLKFQQALGYFQKAIVVSGQQLMDIQFRIGMCKMAMDRFQQAIQHFNQHLVEADIPQRKVEALQLRGMCFMKLNQIQMYDKNNEQLQQCIRQIQQEK